jgi:DNA ligase-1
MIVQFKPVLAAKVFSERPGETEKNLSLISFPALVSIKLDGWRMLEWNRKAICRSLKPPRNRFVQRTLAEFFAFAEKEYGIRGLDGEIVVGEVFDPHLIEKTTSGVSSEFGEPDYTFHVFDTYQYSDQPFDMRYSRVESMFEDMEKRFPGKFPRIRLLKHHVVKNLDELMSLYENLIEMGAEGVCGRKLTGHYKMGRSTMRESILWALKPYVTEEATVIGFQEEYENANELTYNELGYAERKGSQDNLIPKGRLGAFICSSPKYKVPFNVGAGIGMTHQFRQEAWDNRPDYLGATVTYKHQSIGSLDRPRQAKFIEIRKPENMSED